jgi:hypothetical protein
MEVRTLRNGMLAAAWALAACGSPVVGGGDSGRDASVSCDGGQLVCGARCADPQTDNLNCGACGTVCPGGQSCRMGRCEIQCPSGQTVCNGACVSLQADRANCGACGTSCPEGQVCSMGRCATSCGAGLTDCMGSCRDVQNDRLNCGACGTTCAAGQVCVMGACQTSCPMGQTECGGLCVNTQTDRGNCGMCGTACAAGQVCTAGRCELSCAAGQTACGTPAMCVNTQSDRANCGMCGNACASGLVCSMGECVPSCRAGQTLCAGSCTSTAIDPNHCGACGMVCGPYANAVASCASSMCIMTCDANFADCNSDRGDGCEVATLTDVNNCGRCGNRCAFPNAVAGCGAGSCTLVRCLPGFSDADGIRENGCETRTIIVGGMVGSSFSDGTIRDLSDTPGTGISPAGMVTTTTQDFLWIPNVNESTLSKWDAATGMELARYRVGLASGECRGSCCHVSGCNMPSRTVVDGNGDAYVANRAFNMQGTVTKVAADRRDCVDRNGNGVIDTSTGAMDVRPYGADECVLWTANVGPVNATLRALAIDRGDAMAPGGYPWVGSCPNSGTDPGQSVWKLDPRTGAVIRTVGMPWGCSYGAVGLADGSVWFHRYGGFGGGLVRVDTTTNAAGPVLTNTTAGSRCTFTYGVSADANGRLWMSGVGCNAVVGYDPRTNQWTEANIGETTGLGITVDTAGNIWTPTYPAGRNLIRFPASAFTPGGTIPAAMITRVATGVTFDQVSAIGADRSNNIWVTSVDTTSRMLRYETAMARFTMLTGPNRVYTYTDFTGSVRRTSIPQGSYEQTFDLSCAAPRIGALTIDGMFPAETVTSLTVRTATTVAGLATATPVLVASLPANMSPYNLANILMVAGITPAQHLRVSLNLRAAMSGAVPTVRGFDVRWTCP